MNESPQQRLLAEQALERPALLWSPFADHETRGYSPVPLPADPERPFGIVRRIGEDRWQELTGHREELTNRSYLTDALAGLIRDWRISHWWNDDPQATNCLLCGEPNPNPPQYNRLEDRIQCQVMRDYTMDSYPAKPPLRERMNQLVDRDIADAIPHIGPTPP